MHWEWIAICCIAQCMLWNVTLAMMASPLFFTEYQPDGTRVALRLRGDEKSHWLTDINDFVVLEDEDGTLVYAIEEEENDDEEKTTGLKKKLKLVPSRENIVGKLNSTTLFEDVDAERFAIIRSRNRTNSRPGRRFARHHPQLMDRNVIESDCFKTFCGNIQDQPSSKLSGRNRNGGRNLRKQRPKGDDEQLGNSQFHIQQSTLPTTGVIKNLVILLQFKDHEIQKRSLPDYKDIEALMNNLTDVYIENSFGKLTIESTVVPVWYNTTHSEAWYAEGKSGTTNLHEAMREALDYLQENNLVDLLDFDGNGDGYVDSVTFLHSGYGAEHGGVDCMGQNYPSRIWTHQWQLFGDQEGKNIGPWVGNAASLSGENIKVWNYQMVSALKDVCGGTISPVGALAHEFGHTLGLPDLASGGGNGIGGFCLMADAWGFDETLEQPSQLSAWSKLKLGWLEAHKPQLGTNEIAFAEEPSETTSQLYKIGDGEFNFPKDEYLLIEYRLRRGLDSGLPGEGLLIYHIDESPNVAENDLEGHPWQEDDWPRNGKHYQVALIQADRLFSLERGINNGGEKDFFTADYVDALIPSKNNDAPWEGPFPNTDSYQDGNVVQTGVKIFQISSAGGPTMSFTFRANVKERLRLVPQKKREAKTREAAIDVNGSVLKQPSEENRWKWKLNNRFDLGSIRIPEALGHAMEYKNRNE